MKEPKFKIGDTVYRVEKGKYRTFNICGVRYYDTGDDTGYKYTQWDSYSHGYDDECDERCLHKDRESCIDAIAELKLIATTSTMTSLNTDCPDEGGKKSTIGVLLDVLTLFVVITTVCLTIFFYYN